MKSSIAPSWAATSVPVETTLNSLMSFLISGWSAKALAVLIIWMRQVLPTKPLATAIRYGPSFFGHWKYLVDEFHGLKHPGSAPGPETVLGPAKATVEVRSTDNATLETVQRCAFMIDLPPSKSAALSARRLSEQEWYTGSKSRARKRSMTKGAVRTDLRSPRPGAALRVHRALSPGQPRPASSGRRRHSASQATAARHRCARTSRDPPRSHERSPPG